VVANRIVDKIGQVAKFRERELERGIIGVTGRSFLHEFLKDFLFNKKKESMHEGYLEEKHVARDALHRCHQ